MSRYSNHDPYVDAETGVLVSRLGILNRASLDEAEANLISIRSQELWLFPLQGRIDFTYLKNVHRHLFQDMYAWAGELRTVDISKGDNGFAHHAFLEHAGRAIFEMLASERYLAQLDATEFCQRVAFYLGELNALHPFRDGNGRAQRKFIQLLARKNGYSFHWSKVGREEMLQASIESFRGDGAKLTASLRNVIQELSR